MADDHERQMAAGLLYEKQFLKNRQRLESMTARHWPELTYILDLKSATCPELLAAYGDPAAVAADKDGARRLMRKVGRALLAEEKIQAVIASASSSFGVPQIEAERDMIMAIASEALRNKRAASKAVKRVESQTKDAPSTDAMRRVVRRRRRSWSPLSETPPTTRCRGVSEGPWPEPQGKEQRQAEGRAVHHEARCGNRADGALLGCPEADQERSHRPGLVRPQGAADGRQTEVEGGRRGHAQAGAGALARRRGTVTYVSESNHVYDANPEHREEGGTPAIVGSIRAGLVFQLKEAAGWTTIREREGHFIERATASWADNPNLVILGNHDAWRLSIVSFVVKHGEDYLHHNFIVAVLNDLLGIQARGGCSCAGPYGHRLLGIDFDTSREVEREIDPSDTTKMAHCVSWPRVGNGRWPPGVRICWRGRDVPWVLRTLRGSVTHVSGGTRRNHNGSSERPRGRCGGVRSNG